VKQLAVHVLDVFPYLLKICNFREFYEFWEQREREADENRFELLDYAREIPRLESLSSCPNLCGAYDR
jgi:hypothetical protein